MRHSWRVPGLLLVLMTFLAACGGTPAPSGNTSSSSSPVTLNVFAAASLTESFNEIKTQYVKAHPNANLTFNFNGSQILAQQIINGASADVFASADQANMQKVTAKSLVNDPQIFVKNKLTVIIPANNPGNIQSLKDLARKGVKLVVAAPTVPVGKYGMQVLDKMGASADYGQAYESAVKANVVSQEENVKAVVQKVQLGEADAGIVYTTDITRAVADKVKFIDIPDNFNVIAQYPIAVVKNSAHASDAQDFVKYILSADGQAVLQKYRFITISNSGS